MSQPITWQNVNTPDLRGVAAIGGQGAQLINSGFDAFSKILADREATDKANWVQGKDNNTNAFLAAVMKYQDPAAYQQAMADGTLQGMLDSAGAQIDSTKALQAMDGRQALLQDRQIKTQQFQDVQAETKQRDFVNGFKQAITAAADANELDRLREGVTAYAGLGHINGSGAAALAEALTARSNALTGQKMAADKQAAELTHMSEQDKIGWARVAAERANGEARLQAALARAEGKKPSGDEQLLLAREQELKDGPLGSGVMDGSPESIKTLRTALKDMGLTDNAINDVQENVMDAFKGGKFKTTITRPDGVKDVVEFPVPIKAILDAALRTSEVGDGSGFWFTPAWSRRGDKTESALKGILQDPKYIQSLRDAIYLRDAPRYEALDRAAKEGKPIPLGKDTAYPKR